jgi:hypothetical protein
MSHTAKDQPPKTPSHAGEQRRWGLADASRRALERRRLEDLELVRGSSAIGDCSVFFLSSGGLLVLGQLLVGLFR